jgi:pimeloyl-ACP methyl ester carboxylesterase
VKPEEILWVLVHDAWLGGWAWEAVSARLTGRGWTVLTLDLPGHGETALAPEEAQKLTLASYAQAVVEATTRQLGQRKAVLVGHGTAGPVIQLAAERLEGQVAALAFVGAYILREGESIAGQMPPEIAAFFKELAARNPTGRLDLQDLPDFWRYNLINDDPRQADRLLGRLVPEPTGPLFEPAHFTTFFQQRLPYAYLSFNEDMSLPVGDFYPNMPNKLFHYRHLNINAGHEGIITRPLEVAESLMFLASQDFK